MDHSSLLPLFICNLLHFSSEKPGPQRPAFIPLKVYFQHTCGFKIVNLHFCGKYIYQLQYGAYAQFLLPSVLQIPFISKVT